MRRICRPGIIQILDLKTYKAKADHMRLLTIWLLEINKSTQPFVQIANKDFKSIKKIKHYKRNQLWPQIN